MTRRFIFLLVDIIQLAILVRVIISFFPDVRYSKFGDLVYQVTDPIIKPCQMILYKIGLGNMAFDFSPVLAYFILRVIVSLLFRAPGFLI